MQTSPPKGCNYLWRCGPLKGSSDWWALRLRTKGKRVQIRRGCADTHLPPTSPPASPGKKAALKKKLSGVTTCSFSYNSQYEAVAPQSLSMGKFSRKSFFLVPGCLILLQEKKGERMGCKFGLFTLEGSLYFIRSRGRKTLGSFLWCDCGDY